jgi:hypothetical protein
MDREYIVSFSLFNVCYGWIVYMRDGEEAPSLLIINDFSFVKYEKIMAVLEEFYDKYKAKS